MVAGSAFVLINKVTLYVGPGQ